MVTNVIIFGTGIFFLRRKNMLTQHTNIVAFLDNDKKLHGKYFNGALVYSPLDVFKLNYDKIVLATSSPLGMKEQLLSLGILESKIMFWEEYVSSISHGVLTKYNVEGRRIERGHKSILIIVPVINYAGGFLTAFYAAIALKMKGNYVVIAAPTSNNQTVLEVNEHGIDVWICPSLPYVEEIEWEWIQEFDFVLVNSLQNMICVSEISKKLPTMWWLHENREQYEDIIGQYGKKVGTRALKKADIYAVSNLAASHFKEFYPDEKVKRLVFGLPDFYNNNEISAQNKIIIALIGTIVQRKNQVGFINTIKKLPEYERSQIECWIIGRNGGRQYNEELKKLAGDLESVKICGEYSRKEMEQIFSQIDIVVCPSLEETMSIAIVEGMMNKKICITNDNTGVAEYIRDKENGFVYKAGDESELLEKLKYAIQNFKKLDYIKNGARETYEKYFSMKRFSDNIQNILENNFADRV